MGLDNLLATMERRAADTPDTPCNRGEVSAKPAPIQACTFDTHDTSEKTTTAIAKPETLQDRQREARRQKVIAMLEATPGTQRAIYVDDASDPANIIVTVAVRHPTGATCEMLVSKAGCDAWQLLELIERHGAKNVH
ncbi:MAG: Uncharacterized protein AWT59_0633 [Candidatus Gallionella acididurans]|uniref:Uncharacterized protein n=1 Tax=Candidatus Gallionella acididurans TaxID=1796491 RepID=A0A139BW39_9PROT|nr:MAG: Uncharacterized protein AWT59_0633 [Candidatus Gallionella acididurans]